MFHGSYMVQPNVVQLRLPFTRAPNFIALELWPSAEVGRVAMYIYTRSHGPTPKH